MAGIGLYFSRGDYPELLNACPQSSPVKRKAELFKTIGVAVLVLGFITASILYWSGEKPSAHAADDRETSALGNGWKDGTLSPGDLKGSSRTVEMNYGKVAVLLVDWLHRWEQLKPHQLLAVLIATIGILTAASCFLVANRLLRDRP
jgi:hypothetical protein